MLCTYMKQIQEYRDEKSMSIEMRIYALLIKVETKRLDFPMIHLQIENQLVFHELQITCYN